MMDGYSGYSTTGCNRYSNTWQERLPYTTPEQFKLRYAPDSGAKYCHGLCHLLNCLYFAKNKVARCFAPAGLFMTQLLRSLQATLWQEQLLYIAPEQFQLPTPAAAK